MGDARGHLAESAQLLAPDELILGLGQLFVGPRPVLVETRAAQGEGGQAGQIAQHPFVVFREPMLHAAKGEHSDHLGAREHGHADPVPHGHGGLARLHSPPSALAEVVIRADRAAGLRDERGEASPLRAAKRRRVEHPRAVTKEGKRNEVSRGLVGDSEDHVADVEEPRDLALDGFDHVLLVELARYRAREIVQDGQLGEQRLRLLQSEPGLTRELGILHGEADLRGYALDEPHFLGRELPPGAPPDEEDGAHRRAMGHGGREEHGMGLEILEDGLGKARVVPDIGRPGRAASSVSSPSLKTDSALSASGRTAST